MVRRRRKIVWSKNAISTRKNIFIYWNNRNKSKIYSKKLHQLFIESLEIVANYPKMAISTDVANVRLKLVNDYYLIYQLTSKDIILVVDIWDTRQNPLDFPIK
jgi:toxin YoeB